MYNCCYWKLNYHNHYEQQVREVKPKALERSTEDHQRLLKVQALKPLRSCLCIRLWRNIRSWRLSEDAFSDYESEEADTFSEYDICVQIMLKNNNKKKGYAYSNDWGIIIVPYLYHLVERIVLLYYYYSKWWSNILMDNIVELHFFFWQRIKLPLQGLIISNWHQIFSATVIFKSLSINRRPHLKKWLLFY
jgi:hypothetical protein